MTSRRTRCSGVWLLLAALALVAAACGGDDTQNGDLSIVVTTTPLGDVVRNVVGDDATVDVLFPIGADSHSYQPSSQQVAMLTTADLVVANGLGLEEGLGDVLESAAADGANVFAVGPEVNPLPFGVHGDVETNAGCRPAVHHDEEGGDEHELEPGTCDPHVWMDPIRMGDAAREIASQLAVIDPSVDWASRAEAYATELAGADGEIADLLAAVPAERRKLVTNHDAFGYFAARYGFEIVGVVIPGGSTLADPSSAELAELVDTIIAEEVPAVFAETSEPTNLAEAVAAEVGGDVQVVELYTESLGGPGSGAETLIDMLTTNAQRIAAALS